MKRKRKNRLIIRLLPIVVAIGAICWDFSTTLENMVEDGTFRYESEFDAVSGATYKIGIVPSDYKELSNQVSRTTNPSYDHIEEMVRKAVELQGGIDWIVEKGDQVMLKVNLVGRDSPSGEGENTDVRVVKALMKVIHDVTEGDVEIIIGEGTARENDDPSDSESVWANSGYTDLLTDPYLSDVNFRLLNLNQTIDSLIEVDLGEDGTSAPQGTSYMVHKAQLEADVFIAVPVLKIHNTGITNALKLQIGTAPGCYYGYNKTSGTQYSQGIIHDVDHRRWTTEAIVDLANIADIDFVLVDAIMCLEKYKAYQGDNQVRLNTVIAGVDPVAVDHVSAKLMGLNPDDVAHITLAEKLGLGSNDTANIKLRGASIEEARIKVIQNQEEEGKFGQSNRIWILSKAYEGTDIEEEYIENEAKTIPVAGKDGWSEPVYFFDDRIDLLSFYEGASDIVSYAFTHFQSPEKQEAELWLGTHEGIIVYVNGEEAYSSTSTHSYNAGDIGSHVTDISLKKGENNLLVKTINRFGDYSFALNICEQEDDWRYAGNRIEGLKFYQKSQGTNAISEEKYPDIKIQAYPNPAKENVNIRFNNPVTGNVRIEIIGMNGKIIKTLKDGKLQKGKHTFNWKIDRDQIKPGIYLCRFHFAEYQKAIRIQIQ